MSNKTRNNEAKREYFDDILNGLYDFDENATKQEKAQEIKRRFYSEYGHNIDRVGRPKAVEDWLQGLALNIDFYYSDIEETMRERKVIKATDSEKRVSELVDNYWHVMAAYTCQLMDANSTFVKSYLNS